MKLGLARINLAGEIFQPENRKEVLDIEGVTLCRSMMHSICPDFYEHE
jgi:hypothetical protein